MHEVVSGQHTMSMYVNEENLNQAICHQAIRIASAKMEVLQNQEATLGACRAC
jgi:hypothetical protein